MFTCSSWNYHLIFNQINTDRHSRNHSNNWLRIKAFVKQLEQKPRRKVLIRAENLRFYMSALLTSHFLICRLESWVFYEHLMCDLIARTKIFTSRETFVRWKLFSVATDSFSSRWGREELCANFCLLNDA